MMIIPLWFVQELLSGFDPRTDVHLNNMPTGWVAGLGEVLKDHEHHLGHVVQFWEGTNLLFDLLKFFNIGRFLVVQEEENLGKIEVS